MKQKLYILLSLFIISFFTKSVWAQTCDLNILYTTTESRCVSTGSITVNVSGGSGSYNYKVVGTINTTYTSSNNITGLPAGVYKIVIKDLDYDCEVEEDSVIVSGSYSDPRFSLTKTDVTCVGDDGTISLSSQEFGRGPFLYTIIAPSPASVGDVSLNGSFGNLIPGEYFVQLKDSCGGIQVRRITIEDYSWWFDAHTITKISCDSADVSIRLRDSRGYNNVTDTVFEDFEYAIVTNGDTTWFTQNEFRYKLGTLETAVLLVKDPCGNIKSVTWTMPAQQRPAVGSVTRSNITCITYRATVTGQQNLTLPQYCLYNYADSLLACNTTGIFDSLVFDSSYCIKVTDGCYDTTIVRCFTFSKPPASVSNTVNISNRTCTIFRATITGQTNLINPNYCLTDTLGNVLQCNSTGVFDSLAYGAYCIKITDDCADTTITRCINVSRLVPTISNPIMSNRTCTMFDVSIGNQNNLPNPRFCLYDSLGNVLECNDTGIFDSLAHGSYCIRAISECGDTTAPVCFTGVPPSPTVNAAQTSNFTCTTFTATLTGNNLTNPQFCLLNTDSTQIACNTTGIFTNIPYGSYIMKMTDGCVDTSIYRNVSASRPVPSVAATMQQSNSTCSTFTATVLGNNLINPTYCLYNSNNVLVSCNNTGIFTNLPYGTYCVRVENGCSDTTITVCQTFTMPKTVNVTSTKSCNNGFSNITVNVQSPAAPYTIKIFHPLGATLYNATTSNAITTVSLAGLPVNSQYKVVVLDNCGGKDTILVTPDATRLTKSVAANTKCPSATWTNGSGDLTVTAASNHYSLTPTIIKKDGTPFFRNYTSNSGNNYTFTDLAPGSYIVEYNMATCNTKLYDTVMLLPYSYPNQSKSAIYQCDNNSFSLGAVVNGGVGPYTYEIIGSQPTSPSIITGPQTNPIFNINNGTTYSLVRLRTIDACGNGTLSDVSVLPLQNIIIKATSTCLYTNVVLSVDTIPNATYIWYKKTSATDSTQVSDSANHTIPFFVPEDIGIYVCKVSVNNGCLERIAYFNLDGDCGYWFLPLAIKLNGQNSKIGNELFWNTKNEKDIKEYIIERKEANSNEYVNIGRLPSITSSENNTYTFIDKAPAPGTNFYRVKVMHKSGAKEYTNIVSLKGESFNTTVYPNPVKNVLNVSIAGTKPTNYHLQLMNMSGQVVYHTKLENVIQTTFTYNRNKSTASGVYILKVTNLSTGIVENYKVVFE